MNAESKGNRKLHRMTEQDKPERRVISWLLHPFLFAIFPALSLLAVNIGQIQASQAIRSIIVSLIAASTLLFLFRVILRDWHSAGIIVALAVILFSSYGHVYALTKDLRIGEELLGRHRYLIPLWALAAILGIWLVASKIRSPRQWTQRLNLIAVFLLVVPVYTIAGFTIREARGNPVTSGDFEGQGKPLRIQGDASPPDIYHIVVDAYARTDVLDAHFDYDNRPFLDFLRRNGFYIAEESNANYLFTASSLASTLNMSYLDDLDVDIERGVYNQDLAELVKHSEARRQLESLGYVTFATASGWNVTELYDANQFLYPEADGSNRPRLLEDLNAFESLLLRSTSGLILLDIQGGLLTDWITSRANHPFEVQREFILSAFRHLQQGPSMATPKYFFVHIISPHRPYLFGPNGEEKKPRGAFTFASDNTASPEPADAVLAPESQDYLDQLIYITRRLEETIERILSQSEQTPIILLQSDHGPDLGLNWLDPEEPWIRYRMGILNAYLLPGDCSQMLYPTITPVNSYRTLFNCAFGGSYDLLRDDTYFDNSRDRAEPEIEFTPVERLIDGG